jgi:hypothetical protein
MTLLRFVFYWTLKSNIQLKAKRILSSFNKFADYISRVQVEQFRMLAPSADRCPCLMSCKALHFNEKLNADTYVLAVEGV